MTEETHKPALARRNLLRGGAVLAGAAGVTVIGAAVGSSPASAADGGNVVLGQTNSEISTTIIENSTAGTLVLELGSTSAPNPGAALRLRPVPFDSNAPAMTSGSLIGGPDGLIYTANDYADLSPLLTAETIDPPVYFDAQTPSRILDTRTAAGRANILGSQVGVDSDGRLKAGASINVRIPNDDGDYIYSVFVNVTVAKSAKGGFLTVYPAGEDTPDASTVNYQANIPLSNAAFVGVGDVGSEVAIRITSSQLTHVIVDLSGIQYDGGDLVARKAGRISPKRQAYQRRMAKMKSALKR